MRRDERQMWLQDRYFFTCECPSCKTVVQPDLLLFSFRCPKAGCNGVVPGPSSVQQPDQSGDIRDSSTEVTRFQQLTTDTLDYPDCCISYMVGYMSSQWFSYPQFFSCRETCQDQAAV